MKPVIAIIGRPNVGKSTLFNRLARKRQAIVEDEPGVTRDRLYTEALWDERAYILVDTGGFEPAVKEGIEVRVREQAEAAIAEADAVLFLLDGREGLTPADEELARRLRRAEKPVFYVVNKIDGERAEENLLADFYRLGVEPLYAVSAEHGRGVGDLMDEVLKALPPPVPEEEPREDGVRVAIVGRPNVGKSSLLNRLIGKPRAIVDAAPGTTRDAIDTPLVREGRKYVFIDTAGLRRKSRITAAVEKHSTLRALRSLERCDVALVLIDGFEGLTEQDARIAQFAAENGRAILLVVNKWDLVAKETNTMKEYQERIRREMKTLDYAPILFISALSGQRVGKIFAAIEEVAREHRKRISTGELNRWLEKTIQEHPLPVFRRHAVKLYYISQVAVAPPTFLLFTNDPRGVDEEYTRYLARRLRAAYGFAGTPLRLFFRQREKK